MTSLHRWFLGLSDARLRLLLILAILAVVSFTAVSALTGFTEAAPWVGGISGVVLYGFGYVWVERHASDSLYDRLDIKSSMELKRRRVIVITTALTWATLLVVISQSLPEAGTTILGTIQVVVVGCLVNAFLMTDDELVEAAALEAERQVLVDEELEEPPPAA